MGTCFVCGKEAGVGRDQHEVCPNIPGADKFEILYSHADKLNDRAGLLRPIFILVGMLPGAILFSQNPNTDWLLYPLIVLVLGIAASAILADILVNLLRTIALRSKLGIGLNSQ
jgi:hypothetical protein